MEETNLILSDSPPWVPDNANSPKTYRYKPKSSRRSSSKSSSKRKCSRTRKRSRTRTNSRTRNAKH